MEFRSQLKHTKISAFKARQVADLIRGKKVEDAISMLHFMPQKASTLFENVIKSAIANAEQASVPAAPEDLVVKRAYVDEGPTMKRIRFRAQGRVNRIRKRTSHITVVLEDVSGGSAAS